MSNFYKRYETNYDINPVSVVINSIVTMVTNYNDRETDGHTTIGF